MFAPKQASPKSQRAAEGAAASQKGRSSSGPGQSLPPTYWGMVWTPPAASTIGQPDAPDEREADRVAAGAAGTGGESLGVQPKLVVGSASDPLESQADAFADRVMRMSDPSPTPAREA